MSSKKQSRKVFDIIVIGAGSGGLNIASAMNTLGFKVLLVSKTESDIGGDCLNTGCIPSKALIHVAKIIKNSNDAKEFGITVNGKVDFKKVSSYIQDKIEVIREHETKEYFESKGMAVAIGNATFNSKKSILVNGNEYFANKIVLATGSKPRALDLPGIKTIKPLTNETIFNLKKLPEKLLIIGGGPIGIELGQAFQRLGSKVTILEAGSKFLPKEDQEISKILLSQLKSEGVNVLFNVKLQEIKKSEVIFEHEKKAKKALFNEVLVSIGRELNTDNLNLAKAGIKKNKHNQLIIDEYLRTTNKDILVSGDVAGSFQFTHAAELHASVILNNLFSPLKKKVNYDSFSWVTYTDPEIATFGQSLGQLKQKQIPYAVEELSLEDNDRSITDNSRAGKIKLYISKGKILGGTMIGENAGEIVQELVLSMHAGVPVSKIFSKIYAYPTASRINKRVIQLMYSKGLNSFKKKVLKILYRWVS